MKTYVAVNGAIVLSKLFELPSIINWNHVIRKYSGKTFICKYCNTPNLTWSFDFSSRQSLPYDPSTRTFHLCLKQKVNIAKWSEEDISPGECRYCGTKDVVWVKRADFKRELTEPHGLPHHCEEGLAIFEAHKEALREDYARTKKWILSFKDDAKCRRCKATGHLSLKNKKCRFGVKIKKCPNCKGIGQFTPLAKKLYLKNLRKQYWPYKPWMKWKVAV